MKKYFLVGMVLLLTHIALYGAEKAQVSVIEDPVQEVSHEDIQRLVKALRQEISLAIEHKDLKQFQFIKALSKWSTHGSLSDLGETNSYGNFAPLQDAINGNWP